MRQPGDVNDEEQVLSTDGLEVEEVHDEDTIRQFVAAWRRRVSREYARALLQDRPTNGPLAGTH